MLSKSRLWSQLDELLKQEGMFLFEMEMPSIQSATMRIFISKQGGVTLDDCASASRKIAADLELSKILENYNLEVSSPGINRKLSRPEHFAGAVGERVKLTLKVAGDNLIVGTLKEFDGDNLEIVFGDDQPSRKVAIADISKARVDFVF